MIVDNFLLPRFLILELVFACHYLQYARACTLLCGGTKVNREEVEAGGRFKEDATLRNSAEINDKIVPKKGLIGLKNILTENLNKKSKDYKFPFSARSGGLKSLKQLLMCDADSAPKKCTSPIENKEENKESWADQSDLKGILGLKSVLQSPLACEVSLGAQDWLYPPLFYNMTGAPLLPLPSSSAMVVRMVAGESIELACPGSKVNKTELDSVIVKCVQKDIFLLNSTKVDIEQLGCSMNPVDKEVLDPTAGQCGPDNSGRISQLGFQLNTSNTNVNPVVTVCHAQEGEVTHYTNHTLLGPYLHTRSVPKRRPNFREGQVYFVGVSANSAYKQSRQRKLFKNIFGSSEPGNLFQPYKGLYFARGHLTPSADLIYRDWQETTFLYSNIVPQWQVVNNGNWKDVEFAVRARAESRGSILQVFTGTLGVLKLRGKELWLVQESIPVPKYLWKLVVDTNGDSVVFVTLNNPHLARVTRSVALCSDVCEESGWGERLKERTKVKQGYTQCCDTKQFREKVPWLPNVEGENLLVF